MNKSLLISVVLSMCGSLLCVSAQDANKKGAEKDSEYRRSSLCLILMDESGMPQRENIINSFLNTPVPDKFNDHNIAERVFSPDRMVITEQDMAAYKAAVEAAYAQPAAEGEEAEGGKKTKTKKPGGGGFGKFMKAVGGEVLKEATGMQTSVIMDDKDKYEFAVKAYKHLLEEKIAKQLFDRWFIDQDGNFSMDLVSERGLYGASMLDVQTAMNSVRGTNMLADAGEELVNNTFVVVSRYRYISKDDLVAEIDAAMTGPEGGQSVVGMALKASLGAGYYVRATSYLFQLNWNADISNTFYADLWDNPEAYEASDIFSLKYIGQESAFANVKAGAFSKLPQEELISIATVNATDAVLAKLQKKYEVFRTKTPIVVNDGVVTAFIGMKEGVEDGSRFEVLEQVLDAETGKTSYKRKGTVRAVKGKVWDNRYMAAEELAAQGKSQNITYTEFEGNVNGLYTGMLLRQIK